MIEPKKDVRVNDVSQHPSELDQSYRDILGENVHHGFWITGDESIDEAAAQLSHRLANDLKVQTGEKICDIGCGYGATSQILADDYGVNATGFTISESQFAIATTRKSTNGSLRFRLRDWMNNGLKGQRFDAAFSIESSEHMPDKNRFFSELYRTLKPGGRFVVYAWCADELPNRIEIDWLLEPICREGRLPSLLSGTEYVAVARAQGFEKIETENITKNVEKTWLLTLKETGKYFLKNPAKLKDLLPGSLTSTEFLPSIARIALAYKTGSMKYVMIRGVKPSDSHLS